MICHVVIQDCVVNQKTTYLLTDPDFALPRPDMDAGMHEQINSALADIASLPESAQSDPSHPAVLHLTALLCGLIIAVQAEHSLIELLHLTRLPASLLCDYTASVMLP